jgi:hypothetical protein
MTWRTALGLKPTSTDLGLDLTKAAERGGLIGRQHHATDYVIRNGDHVINLANIHLEYAAAILRRPGRSGVVPLARHRRVRREPDSPHGLTSVATSLWQACTD